MHFALSVFLLLLSLSAAAAALNCTNVATFNNIQTPSCGNLTIDGITFAPSFPFSECSTDVAYFISGPTTVSGIIGASFTTVQVTDLPGGDYSICAGRNGVDDPSVCCSNPGTSGVSTPFLGGNGNNGNMFSVTALTNLRITRFVQAIDGPTSTGDTYKIYMKNGTFVGFESNEAEWQQIANDTFLEVLTTNYTSSLLDVYLEAGQTYSFYVTFTSISVSYTDGNAVGDIAGSDENLEITVGYGNTYSFGQIFQPRKWNGVILYTTEKCVSANFAVTGCPSPPTTTTSSPTSSSSSTTSSSFARAASIVTNWLRNFLN